MIESSNMARKTNKKFMVLSALGIIMVVDLHCGISLNLLNSIIPYESFFMPLFVFISGYFNKVNEKTDLSTYFKKKCKTLLLPYVVIGFIMFWFEWAINSYKFGTIQPITEESLFLPVVNAFTVGYPVRLASPMWFVPALWLVTLVYALLRKAIGKKWNSLIAFLVLTLFNIGVVCITKMFGDTQIVFILLLPLKCLFFMPFMEFGVIYRERLEHGMSKLNTGGNMILLIALLLLNVIRMMCLPQPDDITLDSLYYLGGFTSPYYITPIISSLIGIMFWVTVVDAIGNVFAENRIVNCISENTYYIMWFHLLFFNIINCILLFINDNVTLVPGFSKEVFGGLTYYIWEQYPMFKLVYFVFGLACPLLLKLAIDKIINTPPILQLRVIFHSGKKTVR